MVPARALGLDGEGDVGLRPEHVEIAGEGLAATVELVELTGAEAWVTVAVGGSSVIARAPADFSAPAGAQVHLSVDRDKLLRF